MLYGRNANDMNFLEFEIIDVINKSYDVFDMYKVDLWNIIIISALIII